MEENKRFIDVILPLPLKQLYTYEVSEAADRIQAGMRVVVPFGKRKLYTGLVKSVSNQRPHYATKEVLSVLDDYPIVSELQLKFWDWVADYYMCNPGDVYKASMPAGMKPEGETVLSLNEIEDLSSLTEKEQKIVGILAQKEKLTLSGLRSELDFSGLYVLNKLKDKNIISVKEQLKESYKAKTRKFLKLSESLLNQGVTPAVDDELGRAYKQKEALEHIVSSVQQAKKDSLLSKGFVLKSEIKDSFGVSSAILRELVKKEYFEEYEQEIDRLNYNKTGESKRAELSEHQNKALSEIREGYKEKDVVLLHGVTSSGKTELYIELIEEQIKAGKQVLYLLPEIALSTQIIERLRHVFGSRVGVYHSKYSDAERTEVWRDICPAYENNKYQIILGVRSSVFLPFDNLGLIIVDEEHENTYKQYQPAPRYHAANLSVVLAKFHEAKVLLGTATPSIESYYNAATGKYVLVELTQRYRNIQLPEIIVADRKEAYRKKMMKSVFTPELYRAIKESLKNGEQVILFQNRRGYAPFLQCKSCGDVPRCEHCDVSLTYHKFSNRLVCHYCGFSYDRPEVCNACGKDELKTAGFGTEKIESETQKLFPSANIIRMDMDTTGRKHSYQKIIDDFGNHRADILIGTQMVSKGLDFDNVAVVGIMHADMMLNYPDFRANERGFQLMMQVSGRAGRHKKRGKVIIQANNTQHPIIEDVKTNNYKAMFKSQIADRKLFKYPPYYRLISIRIEHKKKNTVDKAADFLASILKNEYGQLVLGPEYPPVSKVKNWYIKLILFKIDKNSSVRRSKFIINKAITHIKLNRNYRYVRFTPDVDPV
ncbi:MAG: primosomal protein N' [Bacteroidota bacterium]|nr:primosomal protein N' [Bacteroidota bacterium]